MKVMKGEIERKSLISCLLKCVHMVRERKCRNGGRREGFERESFYCES